MKASMKAQATALTVMPINPFIQKTPGLTFDRLDNKLGRMALKYDAIDTARISQRARTANWPSSRKLTNDVGARESIESRQVADIDTARQD